MFDLKIFLNLEIKMHILNCFIFFKAVHVLFKGHKAYKEKLHHLFHSSLSLSLLSTISNLLIAAFVNSIELLLKRICF